jgi:hypothetical protein
MLDKEIKTAQDVVAEFLYMGGLIKDKQPSKMSMELKSSVDEGSQVVITVIYNLSPGKEQFKAEIKAGVSSVQEA